jgi:hypothetical protein
MQAGAWLFRDGKLAISMTQVAALIRANVWHAIAALWVATMHALVVWLILACAGTVLMYLVFVPILKKASPHHSSHPSKSSHDTEPRA